MKEETLNEYQKSINNVVEYINLHLGDPIDLDQLADVAFISSFHFHRIFRYHIGEPVGAYILRLRMERAAEWLGSSVIQIKYIAEKLGYQSPFAFSKAFKKHFGVSPSIYRISSFNHRDEGLSQPVENEKCLPYFCERTETKILYTRIIASYGDPHLYNEGWRKIWKYGKERELINGQNEFIGLSYDNPEITPSHRCRFYACISINHIIKPERGFGIKTLSGGRYAVFLIKGSYVKLGKAYQYIFKYGLSENKCILRNRMLFEKYLNNPDLVEESELQTEIYIPIL